MDVKNYIFFKRHNTPGKGCSSHLFRFKNIIRGCRAARKTSPCKKAQQNLWFHRCISKSNGLPIRSIWLTPPLLRIKFKGTPTTTKKMIKIPCIVQELLYNANKTGQSAHSALGKREK